MKTVFFEDELPARQGSQHFLAQCVISFSQAQGSRNDDDQGLHFVVRGSPIGPCLLSRLVPGALCVPSCLPRASAMLVTRCYPDTHDPAVNCA